MILKYINGSSTTPLINHLKRHQIYIRKKNACHSELDNGSSSKRFKKSNKESLGELLARCAAKDGFSIRGIREFITKRNYEMPKSENSVKTHSKILLIEGQRTKK